MDRDKNWRHRNPQFIWLDQQRHRSVQRRVRIFNVGWQGWWGAGVDLLCGGGRCRGLVATESALDVHIGGVLSA